MTTKHIEKHIAVDGGNSTASVIELLTTHSELSRAEVKSAMHKGAVWLSRNNHTQRLRRIKKSLQEGDTLHLYYDEKILAKTPSKPHCISDEGQYSVWYKPAGVSCQGSKWGDHCTINRLVEMERQHPVFLVHRLDQATSGLILIAHSKAAARELSRLFQSRAIEKRYHAVVEGKLETKNKTISEAIDGREAVSHVSELSYDKDDDQSLLQIDIETGRKHQIRKHLSDIGHPIIGDRMYGSLITGNQADLQLRCVRLRFNCPLTGKNLQYQLDHSLPFNRCSSNGDAPGS